MFSKLNRRFMLTLSLAVCTFLLFFFLFSGFYTIRLVLNDLWQKSSQMQKQYTRSMEFKLAELEELCVFTLHSEEMQNAILSKNNSYISNQLYIVQNSNDNILGVCIADKYGNLYASTSNYTAIPQYLFGSDYMNYLKNNVFLKHYFLADALNDRPDKLLKTNPLFFIQPIRINSKIEGYMFLHCSLKHIIKNSDYEDNIFLSDSSIFLSDGSSSTALIQHETSNNLISEIEFENYKNLSLIYHSPKFILKGDFAFILIVWGITFVFFLFFGFYWIRSYIKSIILPMEKLEQKMSSYTDIQKNKMNARGD